MSRSRILASLSSSRQMMIAWNVSGLSHRPAIIASRPASMRLAMAISPSRDSSSTEPISRRYMRTGSSVRSDGSARASALTGRFCCGQRRGRCPRRRRLVVGGGFLALFLLDDVDPHLGEHRHHVLDLLGGHFLRGQNGVEFVVGDVAARLGGLDQPLDRRVRQVEQRAVALRCLGCGSGLFLGFLRHGSFHLAKAALVRAADGCIGAGASAVKRHQHPRRRPIGQRRSSSIAPVRCFAIGSAVMARQARWSIQPPRPSSLRTWVTSLQLSHVSCCRC